MSGNVHSNIKALNDWLDVEIKKLKSDGVSLSNTTNDASYLNGKANAYTVMVLKLKELNLGGY